MFRVCAQKLMLVLLVALLITPRLERAWAKPLETALGGRDAVLAAVDLDDDDDSLGAVYIESSESPCVTKVNLPGMVAAILPGFSLRGVPALESCAVALGRFDAASDRSWIEACNRGPPLTVV